MVWKHRKQRGTNDFYKYWNSLFAQSGMKMVCKDNAAARTQLVWVVKAWNLEISYFCFFSWTKSAIILSSAHDLKWLDQSTLYCYYLSSLSFTNANTEAYVHTQTHAPTQRFYFLLLLRGVTGWWWGQNIMILCFSTLVAGGSCYHHHISLASTYTRPTWDTCTDLLLQKM